MTSRLMQASEPFHEFYKQLYFVQKWNQQQVEAAINQTEALLDS
jgi:hypothetical protein